jgi:hypothetical protein
VVASEEQRLVEALTSIVESLIPILGVELLVLHHVWLGVAHVSEDVVVHVETTFFDATPFLPLGAHGDDWFEFAELFHASRRGLSFLILFIFPRLRPFMFLATSQNF